MFTTNTCSSSSSSSSSSSNSGLTAHGHNKVISRQSEINSISDCIKMTIYLNNILQLINIKIKQNILDVLNNILSEPKQSEIWLINKVIFILGVNLD